MQYFPAIFCYVFNFLLIFQNAQACQDGSGVKLHVDEDRRLRCILSVTYIPANQSSVANIILPPISLQDKSFNSVNFGGDMLLHRLDVVKLELVYVGFEKSLVIGQSSYSYFRKCSTFEVSSNISSAPTKGWRT